MLLHNRGTVVTQASVVPRLSSVDILFSETVKSIDTKFWWQVPIHHISIPFFFKILNFLFNTIFFVFVNIGPYGRKKFQTTSPLKARIRFTPQKNRHTPGEGLFQSCSKNCEIWNFGFLLTLFANMGPYGSKSFKGHLLWNYAPDLLPKISCILLGSVSTKVVTWTVKFDILNFLFLFFFGRLTW